MATPDYTSKQINRFWAKVNKKGTVPKHCPELGRCWQWENSKTPQGYGKIHLKRYTYAHRIAYELTKGEIPIGLEVCHRCDNRACCNPEHLFLGTHAQNIKDREMKNRGGVNRGRRLTESDINKIRQEYIGGCSQSQICKRFPFSHQAIRKVLLRIKQQI